MFMKKYIIAWVLVKLVALGVFGTFIFSGYRIPQLVNSANSPTPTPAQDKIDRPTSNPFKGDLSKYDREKRAEKLQVSRVMDLLEITVGNTVADIGAGGGWFSVIAAKRVGETGKVYAVDINQDSIKYIEERKKKEKITNIESILGKTDDPLLKKGTIDAVLILNTYHEIAEPIIYLKNLKPALRKDALVGIIDRNGDGDDHGIDPKILINEATKAGFTLKSEFDFVEDNMDYFLVFEISKKPEKNDRGKIKKQTKD